MNGPNETRRRVWFACHPRNIEGEEKLHVAVVEVHAIPSVATKREHRDRYLRYPRT
jgi:hypothetical protein